MIHSVKLDTQKIRRDKEKLVSEVSFIIITSLEDNFSVFSSTSAKNMIPQYGDYLLGSSFKIKTIDITERKQQQFRGDGKIAPLNSTNKIWDCFVTAEEFVDKYPWQQSSPLSFSVEPIYYDEFTNKHYDITKDSNGNPTAYAYNAAGDPQYYNRKLVNVVINFSYAVRTFDSSWIKKYINTCNKNKTRICGITGDVGKFKLINLSAKSAEIDDKSYFILDVKIEQSLDKPVDVTRTLGIGFNALMPEKNGSFTFVKRRVQTATKEEFESMQADPESYPNAVQVWKEYGFYNTNEGSRYITEPVALDKTGKILMQDTPTLDSPNLNIVNIYESVLEDWKPFDFPVNGFSNVSVGNKPGF